jgi:hypothetical protein
MVTEKLKELAELEAKADEIRKTIELERASELARLPEQYGFASMREFIGALKAIAGKKRVSKAKGHKKRARITPELKESIVKALKGKKAATVIANELSVSVASVNLIKKAAGLVKARK